MSAMANQDSALDEAMQVVKVQAYQMKRCLDKNKLHDALKHATTMLSELRANQLSPKAYYELYMAVSSELAHLRLSLQDDDRSADTLKELYQLVQYTTSIVPRLYLLITVGVVYIKVCEERTSEILMDLVEMCRGVQHPIRGLFLRNYLLQETKNLLPDCKEPPSEGCGSTSDSIQYILNNFAEMNKLWVRMQHQGHSREREKREKERRDLRILVGTNLVRLSNLESVDADMYAEVILPATLEQVVTCRDPIAQEYLMEVICQVFPDDFHIKTLNIFLDGCAKLHPKVHLTHILNAMTERLAAFARGDEVTEKDVVELFTVFSAHVSSVIGAHHDMPASDMVSLMCSLVNLAMQCFPDRIEYVDKTLEHCRHVLAQREITCVDSADISAACSDELLTLVSTPLNAYAKVATVLCLQSFPPLLLLFGYERRKSLALDIARKILETGEKIDSVAFASTLCDVLSPLLEDQEDEPSVSGHEEATQAFQSEQHLVACLIHSFSSNDSSVQHEILRVLRKRLGFGGERRIKYTVPPLVNAMLTSVLSSQGTGQQETGNIQTEMVFKAATKLINVLGNAGQAYTAMRLHLLCSATAARCGLANMAEECFIESLLVYEDHISGAKAQPMALAMAVGTLEQMAVLGEETLTSLSQQCTARATQLLKKPDQVIGVCTASHLFWSAMAVGAEDKVCNGKKVLDCLQRARKIACSCVDDTVKAELLVHILGHVVYYYEQQNDSISIGYIAEIINLTRTTMAESVQTEKLEAANQHLQSILDHIRQCQGRAEGAVLFEGLAVE